MNFRFYSAHLSTCHDCQVSPLMCRSHSWMADREGGLLGFPSLPSWGQGSLAPIFSAGFSGNFGDLLRHPSFSNQLAKDPSFNSAMFQSLLSQRSEDQGAMVRNVLVTSSTQIVATACLWPAVGKDCCPFGPTPLHLSNSGSNPNRGMHKACRKIKAVSEGRGRVRLFIPLVVWALAQFDQSILQVGLLNSDQPGTDIRSSESSVSRPAGSKAALPETGACHSTVLPDPAPTCSLSQTLVLQQPSAQV